MVTPYEFNRLIFADMRRHLYDNCLDNKISLLNSSLPQVREEEQNELNNHWLVQFKYNDGGAIKNIARSLGELCSEWEQCNNESFKPDNGQPIYNVVIICNSDYKYWVLNEENLDFEQLMYGIQSIKIFK